MDAIIDLVVRALGQVWVSFTHNWPFLLASILISVGLKLTIDPGKVSAFLIRYQRVGVVGATAAAVATPFCSCGTTAVILGMIASTIPWSPIVAFMVASPLTSPQELVYSAGLFGWPFAIAFFLSSILLGLAGGMAAEFFQARGWLKNQARFLNTTAASVDTSGGSTKKAEKACGCGPEAAQRLTARTRLARPVFQTALQPAALAQTGPAGESCCGPVAADARFAQAMMTESAPCGCGTREKDQAGQRETAKGCGCGGQNQSQAAKAKRPGLKQWAEEIVRSGKQLLLMFLGFAFIGYLLNGIIPASWIAAVFGGGNAYSVPLAATLGLPLYINTEGSLPLVRALIDGGMSQGAALAFLITGAGTSAGALAGALTIARWRVIGVVVGTLWAGSIFLGYAYDMMLAAGLF